MLKRKTPVISLFLAVLTAVCGCRNTPEQPEPSGGEPNPQVQSEEGDVTDLTFQDFDGEPYVVRTALKEYTAFDPDTAIGACGRYTELTVEGKAPDTFREAVAAANRHAEETLKAQVDESVRTRAAKRTETPSDPEEAADVKEEYVIIGCIVNVTRADHVAFSFLETEYVQGPGKSTSDITYRFAGSTFDTQTGEKITLSDLGWDDETCARKLRDAVTSKYGLADLPETDQPSNYAWTADAVGIRFYFHQDTVPWQARWDIGEHTARPLTVGFPYSDVGGEKASALSEVPDSFIAMIERETWYDLPHGDVSICIAKAEDDSTAISIRQKNGETERLTIEYADALSDYYIIRAAGGFYLFRERAGYEEGFFYDFSRPDGGFGRFRYETCQFFDSFLGDLDFAVPYSPCCVHMAEKRRTFGESRYDSASFVPHGHYSFPSGTDDRYKTFVLIGGRLQIDAGNMACRLLEDFPATQIDEKGNELGEITVPAGTYLFFESVSGEASLYKAPPQRSQKGPFFYDCRVSDETRIRFESTVEMGVATEKGFLNRFAEPVALAKALSEDASGAKPSVETFYVTIGGKEYPLISDYFQPNHSGEEIDFGDDLWWQAEGYVGTYELTEEDRNEMKNAWFPPAPISDPDSHAGLVISEDGEAVLDYFGEIFTGTLPEKRYYNTYVAIDMTSDSQTRTFEISLREGKIHSAPVKIQCYSEGLPATNVPSTVEPLQLYLTKQ